MQVVFGMKMAKPEKIADALKKLESLAADDPDFPGVNWDASSHAGVTFHTMMIPVPDAKAQEVLGQTIEIAVGIGADVVCVAAGNDGVGALTAALDESASNRGKSVPPFEMVVSVKQIAEFVGSVAPAGQPGPQQFAKMFEGIGENEGRVLITLQPIERGVRYRVTAEEGVLKAVGAAANAAAAQAQGAPGF